MQGSKYDKAIQKLGSLTAAGWPNGRAYVRASTIQAELLKAHLPISNRDVSIVIEILGVDRITRTSRDYLAQEICAAVKSYLEPREGQNSPR